MILSRLLTLGPRRSKLEIIPARNGAVLAWMKKNFAVTYLMFVVGSGLAAFATYTVVCLLRNPDIRLPFYDDKPRDEYYFNKHYFGASKNTDPRVPPVRMHYNGDLEFPYDNPLRKARKP
ncbi:unnamed protein product [Mesocestoides corti]|uniref:Mitochondrial cytochrome c oxidase subunit VIc/VIIs domain-containing protein n=1 Tax=Mesocestoides corti TaxID=53468 RepID=A0A0R3U2G5_MESCO|nr:unnamed protein product [Mesocestoides corti]